MISISSLTKSYGRQKVLDALNLEIGEGRVTGLAGPNACGKTTLIKSILGLVRPDVGMITVKGKPLADESYRAALGYMPQNADFPGNLTANELFKLLIALRGAPATRQSELVERFGLGNFLLKPLGTLSAGTKQKVSAVAALMFEPPILILDEPTAGFDPVACVKFKELILETAAQGTTVLIVSHIMPELEQLIDDLIFLLDGRILFSGEVERLSAETGTHGLEAGIVSLFADNTGARGQ